MLTPPSLSVSVEEHYQLVDPESKELKAFVTQSHTKEGIIWLTFEKGKGVVSREVQPLPPMSNSISELEERLLEQRKKIFDSASRKGMHVLVAGTHPKSRWHATHSPSPNVPRTLMGKVYEELFFGLHVQVGVEDRNLAIDMMNVSRYMMPHVLAVSASSPFWNGENTGLRSFRAILLENLPRAGMPDQFPTWSSYRRLLDSLLRTNSIESETDVWWDVRVHPQLPLLDFRVCDANPLVQDVLALSALLQAIAAWFWDLRKKNLTFRIYHGDLIKENRWWAARYGIDAKLVDFGKRERLPARSLVREMLHLVMEYSEELGSRRYLERIYTVLESGNSADRQLKEYHRSGSLESVVDMLIAETAQGVF